MTIDIIGFYVMQYLPLLLSLIVVITNFTAVIGKFRSLDYKDVAADVARKMGRLEDKVTELNARNEELIERNEALAEENEELRAQIAAKLDTQNNVLMDMVSRDVALVAEVRRKYKVETAEE